MAKQGCDGCEQLARHVYLSARDEAATHLGELGSEVRAGKGRPAEGDSHLLRDEPSGTFMHSVLPLAAAAEYLYRFPLSAACAVVGTTDRTLSALKGSGRSELNASLRLMRTYV